MDLNYVLAWMVGSAAVIWLVFVGRRHRLSQPGWMGVSAGVLVLILAGAWGWPNYHGWVATAAWVVFMMLPLIGLRRLERYILADRYLPAAVMARGVALLHPWDGLRDLPRKIEILARARSGDVEWLRTTIAAEGGEDKGLGRFTTRELLRAENRWADARRWVETIPARDLSRDPGFGLFYLRALGETGDLDAMLSAHAGVAASLGPSSARALAHLHVAAFTGRVGLAERLIEGPLASMSRPLGDFWKATALQAAGDAASAPAFEEIVGSARGSTRVAVAARLESPVRVVSSDALSPAARAALEGFERDVELDLLHSWGGVRGTRLVTTGLIALNGIGYSFELQGGPENWWNLIRLGALVVPTNLVRGEWWRIFTAGFLHFGPLHLTMNLLGLWVIGGYVERTWGRWRLIAGYFGATFGSCLATLLILDGSTEKPSIMVGASGGVLGVLGVGLAALLVGWRRDRAVVLRRQLIVFSMMVVLQVVFDHFTPMVSSTAHLSGLAIGFAIGLPFALVGSPARKQARRPLEPSAPEGRMDAGCATPT